VPIVGATGAEAEATRGGLRRTAAGRGSRRFRTTPPPRRSVRAGRRLPGVFVRLAPVGRNRLRIRSSLTQRAKRLIRDDPESSDALPPPSGVPRPAGWHGRWSATQSRRGSAARGADRGGPAHRRSPVRRGPAPTGPAKAATRTRSAGCGLRVGLGARQVREPAAAAGLAGRENGGTPSTLGHTLSAVRLEGWLARAAPCMKANGKVPMTDEKIDRNNYEALFLRVNESSFEM
jgi:hypothetical protein